MSLSERVHKVSNGITAPHIPITRRDLLFGAAGLFLGGAGVAIAGAEVVSRSQNKGLEDVFTAKKGKKINISSPEIDEIKDKENYREAAKDLQLKLFPQLNPKFLTDHPELFRAFDDLNSVPFEEVFRRFVIRTDSKRAETGYKDGNYNNTAFYIRNENNEAILTGYIDDPEQQLRIDLQLNEEKNPVQFDSDKSVKFAGFELEGLIKNTFMIPDGSSMQYRNSFLSYLEVEYRNVLDKESKATYIETEQIFCEAQSSGYITRVSNIIYARKNFDYKLHRA